MREREREGEILTKPYCLLLNIRFIAIGFYQDDIMSPSCIQCTSLFPLLELVFYSSHLYEGPPGSITLAKGSTSSSDCVMCTLLERANLTFCDCNSFFRRSRHLLCEWSLRPLYEFSHKLGLTLFLTLLRSWGNDFRLGF